MLSISSALNFSYTSFNLQIINNYASLRANGVKCVINERKMTKMMGMFTNLSIITPCYERLSQNVRGTLQIGP